VGEPKSILTLSGKRWKYGRVEVCLAAISACENLKAGQESIRVTEISPPQTDMPVVATQPERLPADTLESESPAREHCRQADGHHETFAWGCGFGAVTAPPRMAIP
jgi:hypothetical protein